MAQTAHLHDPESIKLAGRLRFDFIISGHKMAGRRIKKRVPKENYFSGKSHGAIHS